MELPDPLKQVNEPEGKDEGKLPEPNEPRKQKPRFGFFRDGSKTSPDNPDELPNQQVEPKIGSFPESSLEKLISHKPISHRNESEPPPQNESSLPQNKPLDQRSDQENPLRQNKDMNPGRRLHAMEEAAKSAPPAKIPWIYRARPTGENTRRAYWDVTATLSLIVNAILVVVLIVMSGQIRNLKSSVSGLLGGLYSNFAKMDQASIDTTISINTEIPLNFTLPVSQNTDVVLTGDVNIPNAYISINTGGININSRANVTLPAGTTLPITMNMGVPVQTTIPINMQLPVSIPLNQTGMHEPFTGLQTAILPFYCTLDKNAQYPEGTFICTEHHSTTTTPTNP
jgi:hypothetical protein